MRNPVDREEHNPHLRLNGLPPNPLCFTEIFPGFSANDIARNVRVIQTLPWRSFRCGVLRIASRLSNPSIVVVRPDSFVMLEKPQCPLHPSPHTG